LVVQAALGANYGNGQPDQPRNKQDKYGKERCFGLHEATGDYEQDSPREQPATEQAKATGTRAFGGDDRKAE